MKNDIMLLVKRGYGLSQLMEQLSLDMPALKGLMKSDAELNNKLIKRFGREAFDEVKVDQVESDSSKKNDGLTLDELKKQADILKIEYNARIGAPKLKEKIEDFLNKNPDAIKLLVWPKEDPEGDLTEEEKYLLKTAKDMELNITKGMPFDEIKALVDAKWLELIARAEKCGVDYVVAPDISYADALADVEGYEVGEGLPDGK